MWKLLPSTENDSCLSQESEIRLKYVFDILLLTLLIKAKLKTDADLLQFFLKQRESEENPCVDTKCIEQTSLLVTETHIPSQVFFSACAPRPPGSPNCFRDTWRSCNLWEVTWKDGHNHRSLLIKKHLDTRASFEGLTNRWLLPCASQLCSPWTQIGLPVCLSYRDVV